MAESEKQEPRQTICPLSFANQSHDEGCTSQCEWWDLELNACVIHKITRSLEALSLSLYRLSGNS